MVEIKGTGRIIIVAAFEREIGARTILVAIVLTRNAPTSLRPGRLALAITSDQANTVSPANGGAA